MGTLEILPSCIVIIYDDNGNNPAGQFDIQSALSIGQYSNAINIPI